MRIKILIVALVCLFLISNACVTTKAIKSNSGPARPPVPADKVIIYKTADQVPGKYVEIALLKSKGDVTLTSKKQMLGSFKKLAGKLGANAIILDAMSEPTNRSNLLDAIVAEALGVHYSSSPSFRKGKAVAIYVFPDEDKKKQEKGIT